MSNFQPNNYIGVTPLSPNTPQTQGTVPTETLSVAGANAAVAAPIISYNIICENEPKESPLAKTTEQPLQTKQQALAQLPFQVNTEVVHNEDELFQVIYNKIVAKLEADKDASSAGKYD